jgi:hypothetical protein
MLKSSKINTNQKQGSLPMSEMQIIVNSLGGAVVFLAGMVANGFRRALCLLREENKGLRKELSGTKEKLQGVEVLVAGKYTTREEHDRDNALIHKKLDEITKLIREVPCNKPNKK